MPKQLPAVADVNENELLYRAALRLRVAEWFDDVDAQDAVRDAVGLCVDYGFALGTEVKVITVSDQRSRLVKVEAIAGVRAFQRSFEIWQRSHHGAHVDVVELTPEELQSLTVREYPEVKFHENDRGAKARFVDHAAARLHKEIGWEYSPPWHYGFWRRNAYEYTSGGRTLYLPDWLPEDTNVMGRQQLANQKAEKACLREKVGLHPVDTRTPERRLADLLFDLREQTQTAEDEEMTKTDPAHASFAELPVRREEDGDILFAAQR